MPVAETAFQPSVTVCKGTVDVVAALVPWVSNPLIVRVSAARDLRVFAAEHVVLKGGNNMLQNWQSLLKSVGGGLLFSR
jgi:hypothetical protein